MLILRGFNKRRWSRVFLVALFLIVGLVLPSKSHALTWEQANTDGFGDSTNQVVTRMKVFNGQIYATVDGVVPGPVFTGARVLRSSDGTTWSQVNTDGFGDTNNIESIVQVYNSALYIGTINASGFELWKTTNGTDYAQIGTDGFGDTDNIGVYGMEVFNEKLYLGVDDPTNGTALFRLDSDTSWTQVNTDGFGSAANRNIWKFGVFGGNIYAGTLNSTTGTEVWRSNDGTTWIQVNTDGFGDVNNDYVSSFFYLGDYLYAGTYNGMTGTEVWRSNDGTTWTQVNTDGFGDAQTTWTGDDVAVINGTIYLGTRNDTDGSRMYVSTNGTTWTQEGSDGFGDVNNYAVYAITFNGRVYIAFSNVTTGAEIWRTTAMSTLSMTPETLTDGTVGTPYSVTFAAVSGTAPFTFSASGLPTGLTLSTAGVLSGTPTTSGSYSVTVSLTDSGQPQQLSSRTYSLTIRGVQLPETGSMLPQGLIKIILAVGGMICSLALLLNYTVLGAENRS